MRALTNREQFERILRDMMRPPDRTTPEQNKKFQRVRRQRVEDGRCVECGGGFEGDGDTCGDCLAVVEQE